MKLWFSGHPLPIKRGDLVTLYRWMKRDYNANPYYLREIGMGIKPLSHAAQKAREAQIMARGNSSNG